MPAEIGRCSRLEILNVSNNRIKALPNELGLMTSLRTLDVNSNAIRVVPPDLGDVVSLETLDVSANPVIDEIDAVARQGCAKLLEYLQSAEYAQVYLRNK